MQPEKSIIIMKKQKRNIVFFIEQNIHGAWVVYGAYGIKQYYGYTKEEARQKYIDSDTIFVNER